MKKNLRIAIAQLNLLVGDVQGNLRKHLQAATQARDELKADVIIFPELSITGYPPEDLLYHQSFIDEANNAVITCKNEIKDIYCLLGHPWQNAKKILFNACSLIYNGKICEQYAKQHLPNYGVFDEKRYFKPGETHIVTFIH